VFGRGTDGHRCRLDEDGGPWAGLEEFSCGRETFGTGCVGSGGFGADGLAADGEGYLWREIGKPRSDVGRGRDKVFVFALFAEFGEGDNGAFWARCENTGCTHKFTPDLEGKFNFGMS
jgi:hypothetical protein